MKDIVESFIIHVIHSEMDNQFDVVEINLEKLEGGCLYFNVKLLDGYGDINECHGTYDELTNQLHITGCGIDERKCIL